MAKDEKQSFPMLPTKNWWVLRKRFQQTIPAKVTAGYLATVLGISEKSAQNNVLPYLKSLGLIDEDNKPTDLANKWRFNENYGDVCKEIREKVYPRELLEAIPNPSENRGSVQSWFSGKTGAGQVAARRMATLYALLSEADASKETEVAVAKPRKKMTTKTKPAAKQEHAKSEKTKEQEFQKQGDQRQTTPQFPSIHIDLQIHLSPEAGAQQIDQIFSSMSKHLKEFYLKSSKSE